jgi:hypothetical protein
MQMTGALDEPRVTAEITFLRADQGGRKTAPKFPAYWCLHVVLQDRSIRHAKVEGREVRELYHPMRIVEAPVDFNLGDTGKFVLTPMYYPQDPFEEFRAGVTFTAREGSRIIAHGVVLTREEISTPAKRPAPR